MSENSNQAVNSQTPPRFLRSNIQVTQISQVAQVNQVSEVVQINHFAQVNEVSQVAVATQIIENTPTDERPRPAYLIRRDEKKRLALEQGDRLAEMMRVRRETGVKNKNRKTKSQKAGVLFRVDTFLRKLKKAMPKKLVRTNSAVLLTGVIEYLVAEVLDLSARVTENLKKKRITPRHLYLAIKADEELQRVMRNVTIPEGGVTPFIHSSLLN